MFLLLIFFKLEFFFASDSNVDSLKLYCEFSANSLFSCLLFLLFYISLFRSPHFRCLPLWFTFPRSWFIAFKITSHTLNYKETKKFLYSDAPILTASYYLCLRFSDSGLQVDVLRLRLPGY